MAKASVTLPSGTVVQIEGTPSEVKELLDYYGKAQPPTQTVRPRKGRAARHQVQPKSHQPSSNTAVNITEIVNIVKTCDEAERIETQILDRASQVDRTLLPLYVAHEHLDNALGLSSGDIAKITTDLGVPVLQPNVSRSLSGTASKYVIGDRVRKKGQPVRYKLSRRGLQYMKAVLIGNINEN